MRSIDLLLNKFLACAIGWGLKAKAHCPRPGFDGELRRTEDSLPEERDNTS